MSRSRKTIVAIMYDFDKTLCTKDMQEYTFIPVKLNMKPENFWKQTAKFRENEKMDGVLAYMYQMLHQAEKNDIPICRDDFVELGKTVQLFPGVDTWFQRVAEYAKKKNVIVEHYVISSGLKEIIEGCPIYKRFKKVYACEFYYNVNKVAKWPKLAVNFTGKTQFLFRINKGALDVSDDSKINEYIPEIERAIPFRNMIYIGDGMTDVPCMQLTKTNGGKSIAVYGRRKQKSKAVAEKIVRDGRANYVTVADYREKSELESLVFRIIDKIAATDIIEMKQLACEKLVKKINCGSRDK